MVHVIVLLVAATVVLPEAAQSGTTVSGADGLVDPLT
jgi:hypothetical protein